MKQNTLLLPTNDFVFKKVFAENPDLLASLLAAALDMPESELESLEVIDAHLRPSTILDKEGILDIKVKAKAAVLDVEIQVRKHRDLPKRIQYYLSSLYVEQLKAGDKYRRLNKAIVIFIAGFRMFDDAHWCHRFHLHDDLVNTRFPESNEIIILELPKVGLATGPLADWMRFVYAQKEEDFMQAAAQNPLISKAFGVIRTLSLDEEARLLAESREKALRDIWSMQDDAREEGWVEGRKEGRSEGMFESALLMLKAGKVLFSEVLTFFPALTSQDVDKLRIEISK